MFIRALFLLLTSFQASAFVENVTHGYVNCQACHISPSGGGVLNDYGRSLSRELMSTWGPAGSEQPLFGLVKNTDWLKVGGDARYIQTYLDNDKVRQGRQFLMQDNVEAAVHVGKTWLVGTVGTQGGPTGTPDQGHFLSERHYILWETSEDTHVRVGKFRINYGLYDPNHTRVVKAPLGFGPNSETYNLEVSKTTDDYELFLTAGLGRLDLPGDPSSERNLNLTYAHYVNGNAKLGFSTLFGENEIQRRTLFGVFAIFPFLKEGIVKFEADGQKATQVATPNTSTNLFASYVQLEYSVAKGVLPYVILEYLQQSLSDPKSLQTSPGVGIQWLPLPHFELQAELKRQSLQTAPGEPNTVGWFVAHFYL